MDKDTSGPFEIRAFRDGDVRELARMHHAFFGAGEMHGHSVAKLGPAFLERIFYRLNLNNPFFRCDLALNDRKIIGFSVYSTNRNRVFQTLLRRRFPHLLLEGAKLVLAKPRMLPLILSNAVYLRGEQVDFLDSVDGWWMVAAVEPKYRSKEFEGRIGGVSVVQLLFRRMEEDMMDSGCTSWYGVVHPDNPPINIFLQRSGAELAGTVSAQGMKMRYYVKELAREQKNVH